MRVKTGVQLDGVHLMLWYAAVIYEWLRQTNGLGEGTITGGREPADSVGAKRVRGTLHPSGRAIDLRTTDLPPNVPPALAAEMRNILGAAYHVVLEADHIHVEYTVPDPVRM